MCKKKAQYLHIMMLLSLSPPMAGQDESDLSRGHVVQHVRPPLTQMLLCSSLRRVKKGLVRIYNNG